MQALVGKGNNRKNGGKTDERKKTRRHETEKLK